MKLLIRILNFYINSSIHVALSVYALVRITEYYFNLPYNEPLDYFIFYGSITGYNFVKYAGIAKLHHRSLTNNLKLIQVFSFICFGLMLFYASQLSLKTISFFIPFGVITLLYALPVLSKLTKNLRSLPSIKIVLIALVWSGVTVLLPLYDTQPEFNSTTTLLLLQRFLFVIALTLPFDIRDVQFDNASLGTIPQRIGVERTKKLGFIVLAICLLIEFFISSNQLSKNIFISVFIGLLFLIQRASTHQPKYYSSFWVEAIPIFWWVLLLIF